VAELPPNIEKVGVFVNQFEGSICALADEVGLTAVQLHGNNEDPRVADLVVKHRSDLKVVVSISMLQPQPEGWARLWRPDVVHAFLVDSGTSSKLGGTGETFDWRMRRTSIAVIATLGRVVIAGGLSPTNVSEAIEILKPWGVDVASGVEAKQGKKDPKQVQAFVAAVRQAGKN
jgi:phosphoribosylanthranilate isomerase